MTSTFPTLTYPKKSDQHWNHQVLEPEEKILQFGLNISQDENEPIEETLKNYREAIKGQIDLAEKAHNVELADALKMRFDTINKFYILAEICSKDLNQDLILSAFIKNIGNQINPLLSEEKDYRFLINFVKDFNTLNQEITQNILKDKTIEEIIEQFNGKLNDPTIHSKDHLEKIGTILSSAYKQVKYLKNFAADQKNQLSFLWQNLVTSLATEYLLEYLADNMQNSWQHVLKKKDIFVKNQADIQHFEGPFAFLAGYLQHHFANFIWNERITLIEKVYERLHPNEDIDKIEYKNWSDPAKFLLTPGIIRILQSYRKSFNALNSLNKTDTLSNLGETVNDYLKKNITSIKETVDILKSLTEFIEQTPYKDQKLINPLIASLNRWIEEKSATPSSFAVENTLSAVPSAAFFHKKADFHQKKRPIEEESTAVKKPKLGHSF